MSPGGSSTPRVDPLPDACASRSSRIAGSRISRATALAAEAKADGTFALGPLPLGSLGIGVSAPRHASRRVDAQVPARGRAVDVGDVALDPGLAIRGRVRDREGSAIADATVRALRQEPGEAGEAEATSGPDGRFDLGGLRPGRHEVSASAPGYATAYAAAEAGGEPVDVVHGRRRSDHRPGRRRRGLVPSRRPG